MNGKRFFDVVAAVLAVVILSPLFLLVAALIKRDSAGPVFFRQLRVGFNGRVFRLYKFRSMIVDAESRGLSVTVGGDARITAIGRFLRKSKLDELPQLINVIKGEMSIVGPRPEVPHYVDCWPVEDRKLILSVRPGLTDFAAIEFRHEEELLKGEADPDRAYVELIIPKKIELYKKYIAEMSFSTDMSIIIRTFMVVVRSDE